MLPNASCIADTNEDAKLAGLMDAVDHPLPIVPVAVPQLTLPHEVDDMLKPGNLPIVFQISQASGPYADRTKVHFFEIVATEYVLKVNFRKVAAGSAAARRLYRAVTKPVYVICEPAKSEKDRCGVVDESELGRDVTQTALEGYISKQLGVIPTLLVTFKLTVENQHRLVSDYRPPSANPPPTARWIAILFYAGEPGDTRAKGALNRLRVLVALERFFYPMSLRFAECDLANEGGVYRALFGAAADSALPTDTELWLFNPDAHMAAKYAPPSGAPGLMDLTHDAFETWLAGNGVARPPNGGIDMVAIWRELDRLAKLPGGQQ